MHILVQDRHVLLSGTVYRYSQKIRYAQIAWQTAEVREVENAIRVVSRYEVEDAAIQQGIRLLIQHQPYLDNVAITVEVTHGMVRLRGRFYAPDHVLRLTHQVAEIEGALALEIDPRFVT